ncbi:MAG: ArsR family transcriptional regulator [Candidatus Lokiarchaeota archaeon]|nr:ArsR family transcriptional regulator [Candidatus Lokiarchaeota archaeon]
MNEFEENELEISLVNILSPKGRVKILEVLAMNDELNITEIIRRTSLNHTCVSNHLDFLKKVDFIQEKRFGRVRIYRYKDENINAHALKKLIELWSYE